MSEAKTIHNPNNNMFEDSYLDQSFEERTELFDDDFGTPAESWPGDGSGEDDLADYNTNEADDYRNIRERKQH